MSFEVAWYWLLLPPLLFYVWWISRRSYAQLHPTARRVSLVLRTLVLLLLIAGVTRPTYLSRSSQHHLVFVLDVSKSITMENLDAALDDIDRLARQAGQRSGDCRISVVAFGRQANLLVRAQDRWEGWLPEVREKVRYHASLPELYEKRTALVSANASASADELQEIEARIAEIERFRDQVAGDQTDIERAMRLALNCGSTHEHCDVYVLTDGNFNQGRWQKAWNAAADGDATVHTIVLDKPLPPEVAAADLALPPTVRVNQGFTAEVHIASTTRTRAELRVFRDGYAVDRRAVELMPGENNFKIPGLYVREKGFHVVEVVVRAEQDTQLQNNTIRSLVVVPGEARILYVDGDEDQIPYLKSALELEGMLVEGRPATGVPQNLSELLGFDAFILSNVPADRLSRRQMQTIRTYVRDFGGGFLMLGGDESFGLGGYFHTPIEEILPVRMPIQKDLIRPSLGIMLVIDKSGSMEGVKIQLAKRAAIATAEAINPRDQIGVIGFDGESRVILELTSAADRATITNHISALDAGGGTFLYPALEDAHGRLLNSNARRKHVIVLSDGQTQGFGYEDIVQAMAADGITLSAVGIGDGADMNLMEGIAMAGGGRAYFTSDLYSIPQIFTREALRASRSMLVERLVQPVAISDDVALAEIDTDEFPLLTGYVATTPKAAANVILVSDSGDPLLANWRYGLGRTVAFTSETKPRWAEDWLEWPDFAKFWSQLVRSVTGENLARALSVECSHSLEGTSVDLAADVRDSSGNFVTGVALELSFLDANGRTRQIPVVQRGPGLFEARVPKITYGQDQQFSWRFSNGDKGEQATSYGFVYSFSPEFRTLGVARDILGQVRTRAGGEHMAVGQSNLVTSEHTGSHWIQLWPYLIVTALLIVPFDILCRRLG
ncbi:MAG: VWA domain-containing protein [Phycisphaerales bacterium]|nr:MAG: VWA domain-containing protein [Phycisphaerales bacterium]